VEDTPWEVEEVTVEGEPEEEEGVGDAPEVELLKP
jgi:hypothetical protein